MMPDAKNRYAISLISQALRVACVFPCIAGCGAESNRSFKLLIRTRKEAGKSFHLKRDQEAPDAVAVLERKYDTESIEAMDRIFVHFYASERPGGANAGRAWRQSGPAVPAAALREHVPQNRSDSERSAFIHS